MARFAAAVNALQVAALDVVVERPAMDLEPFQHVLVADDVCEVLVQSALQICDGLLDVLGRDALVACEEPPDHHFSFLLQHVVRLSPFG